MTQCSSWVGDSPKSRAWLYREKCRDSKDFVNQGGLSRKALFSAVDASIRRLGVKYIDLLQVHRFDYSTPIEETMAALHDLVQSRRVRYIGASSMWVSIPVKESSTGTIQIVFEEVTLTYTFCIDIPIRNDAVLRREPWMDEVHQYAEPL